MLGKAIPAYFCRCATYGALEVTGGGSSLSSLGRGTKRLCQIFLEIVLQSDHSQSGRSAITAPPPENLTSESPSKIAAEVRAQTEATARLLVTLKPRPVSQRGEMLSFDC